jgi:hypothetical protein
VLDSGATTKEKIAFTARDDEALGKPGAFSFYLY